MEKLVEALSEKFFNQISKYTNDFVEIPTKVGLNYLHTQGDSSGQNKTDKDGKEIKEAKEKGQASSSNLALETKRSKENGTLKMVASTSKMTVPVNVNVNVNVESLDNSYHSNKEVKIHVDKSKKERNYFGYKEQKRNELMGTYNRLNDLRKLQLNLFKTSKNSKIKPQDFSEIYYNFRKKL